MNTNIQSDSSRKRSRKSFRGQREHSSDAATIHAVRGGDWAPAEELKELALQALREGKDLSVNLSGVGHLDASVLQVLLAIETEQKRKGSKIQLLNASTDLQKWFEYSGAAAHLNCAE